MRSIAISRGSVPGVDMARITGFGAGCETNVAVGMMALSGVVVASVAVNVLALLR